MRSFLPAPNPPGTTRRDQRHESITRALQWSISARGAKTDATSFDGFCGPRIWGRGEELQAGTNDMVAQADRKAVPQEAAVPLESPPSPAAPVSFDAALFTGGTFAGSAVLSVRLVLADGRVMRLELPQPPAVASEGRRLTAAESAVTEIVEDMPIGTVWSVAQIMEKTGYAVTTDIRRYIRSLKHLLVEHTHGWERAKVSKP